MKIEKITENKIRILLKNEDVKEKNIDLHTIMTKAIESQGFFLEILNQAEKQLGFDTDGYKLLIEAYSSPDNDFVFTITKYLDNSDNLKPYPRKKVVPRIKTVNIQNKYFIYSFNNFDDFCELCTYIDSSSLSARGIARLVSLYEYQKMYYLILKDINRKNENYKNILSTLSEFGKFVNNSNSFENKLLEHGKIIIKHNALTTGIKYFAIKK